MTHQPAPPLQSNIAKALLLSTASGLLLGLPFLHAWLFPLAWIALVPLLFALRGQGMMAAWALGSVTGLAASAAGSYWMTDFFTLFRGYTAPWDVLASLVYWAYAGQGIALGILLFHWLCRRTLLPEALLLPLTMVPVLYIFPHLFPIRPGEAQIVFLVAIQGVDLIGVHGLDFVLFLTSGLVFQLLRRRQQRRDGVTLALGSGVLLAWFTYGGIALAHWGGIIDEHAERHIGIVQPNDAPDSGIPPLPDGYSRTDPPEMELTRELAEADAEFVIWPEARFKGYYDYPQVQGAYRRIVRQLGIHLVFQDAERYETDAGEPRRHNTSTVLASNGTEAGRYRKVKRVPFGEYLPLVDTMPVLRPPLEAFFGEFTGELNPGESHVSTTLDDVRLVPGICYETAFPAFVAGAVEEQPKGSMLVFQSMDNWFGETRQPEMHFRSSVLRAVENRTPMVHAINNGPSGAARADGRIIDRSPEFAETTLLLSVPHDPATGGSLYSRFPRAFPALLIVLLAGLVLRALGPRAGTAEH